MRLIHFSYKETSWELEQAIPLQEVNLLVGRNAVGKSKVIEAISKTALHILQLASINRFSPTVSSMLVFEDKEEKITYRFTCSEGLTTEESLKINESTILLERDKNKTLLHGENINPPEDKLTLHVRRDTQLYPYFEKIVMWAENVYGQRFNEMDADRAIKTNPYLSSQHRDNLFSMLKSLPKEAKKHIIEQARALGYKITSITPIDMGDLLKLVIFKEEGVKRALPITSLSKGMCRAISLLIHMEYLSIQEKPSLWLIDDLGEGLDYDRTTKLGKLLFDFCLEHNIQLIASSNDTFLMDVVDLKYWNILQREGGKVSAINMQNSPDIFESFQFTGLSNFDFFSSDYIARHQQK